MLPKRTLQRSSVGNSKRRFPRLYCRLDRIDVHKNSPSPPDSQSLLSTPQVTDIRQRPLGWCFFLCVWRFFFFCFFLGVVLVFFFLCWWWFFFFFVGGVLLFVSRLCVLAASCPAALAWSEPSRSIAFKFRKRSFFLSRSTPSPPFSSSFFARLDTLRYAC